MGRFGGCLKIRKRFLCCFKISIVAYELLLIRCKRIVRLAGCGYLFLAVQSYFSDGSYRLLCGSRLVKVRLDFGHCRKLVRCGYSKVVLIGGRLSVLDLYRSDRAGPSAVIRRSQFHVYGTVRVEADVLGELVGYGAPVYAVVNGLVLRNDVDDHLIAVDGCIRTVLRR